MKKSKVSLSNLRSYMNKWKKKLRLDDWDMRVDWGNERQMADRLAEDGDCPDASVLAKQAVACTDASNPYQTDTSHIENKKNRILVKINKDMTKLEAESIIAHEMLHVLLWPLAPDDKDASATIVLEQIINILEANLVNNKRG